MVAKGCYVAKVPGLVARVLLRSAKVSGVVARVLLRGC